MFDGMLNRVAEGCCQQQSLRQGLLGIILQAGKAEQGSSPYLSNQPKPQSHLINTP